MCIYIYICLYTNLIVSEPKTFQLWTKRCIAGCESRFYLSQLHLHSCSSKCSVQKVPVQRCRLPRVFPCLIFSYKWSWGASVWDSCHLLVFLAFQYGQGFFLATVDGHVQYLGFPINTTLPIAAIKGEAAKRCPRGSRFLSAVKIPVKEST